ncbi:MAG: serine hydroxymethyltransferase [Pseudomonadota bacterium]|nr:serine hydroxymethyltransferase [Pseudomonadota bacterium]
MESINRESDDVKITNLLKEELKRQQNNIVLIASENYTSAAVMQAQGSVLTNKYAEGYPKKRYYAGCQFIDEVEQLAIDRACELFNVKYANVQPHSGSQANLAVFKAILEPGDCFMGLDLAHGGHLSHGCKANISGQYYRPVIYQLNSKTEVLDYDEIERIAKESKPKLIIAGYSAYALTIDWKRLRQICDQVGARMLADIAHVSGLIAAGLFPCPSKYADVITTTTHKSMRGPRGGMIMVPKDEKLAKKIDQAIFPGLQGGPMIHTIAAKAVAFHEALQPEFKVYQKQVMKNAKDLCNHLKEYGYKITSNGTDTHLFLVDLTEKNITGQDAERALEEIGIITNKNTVPNDKRSPFVTSGLRIGTCAITTRGVKEEGTKEIAYLIDKCLKNMDNQDVMEELKERVQQLCVNHPLYQ